jgi:hypothetical protein
MDNVDADLLAAVYNSAHPEFFKRLQSDCQPPIANPRFPSTS